MSQAAYCINAQVVPRERFYQVACDPQRSVVVEACAGAGKTWMLVSRILRALIDGVAPSQILAITFTRKAAGEMRERLHQWLREFSQVDDAQRQQELVMRGMTVDQAAQASVALAGLYRQWLDEGRGVEIHTIHGWFSRLVRAAPLDALAELGLPPELNLVEDTSELWPELWGRFLRRMDQQSVETNSDSVDPVTTSTTSAVSATGINGATESELDAFLALIRELGRFNLEAWLQSALSNRLEITLADEAGHLLGSVESLAQWSSDWAGLDDPLQALARPSVIEPLLVLAKQLAQSKGAKARTAGVGIEASLSQSTHADQYAGLCAALLTKEGDPRKQLGDSAELAWAQAWLQDLAQACSQAQAHRAHRRMCLLSRALFEEYASLKALKGQVDMVDLERAAAHLLGDSSVAGWIQERLDTQVRQLLMDEFQDTSPLQWQTLKSWLGGYAGSGSGQAPVKVFLVGDPKQSIYRFRRADPRVFEAAKQFVLEGLEGDLLACDHTRRNAPGVIDALNKVMGQAVLEGAFDGFRPHTTESLDPAKVSVLPDVLRPASTRSAAVPNTATNTATNPASCAPGTAPDWRDSLLTPRESPDSSLKQEEAEHVAQAIGELIRTQGIAPEDIFVLSRKRATLGWVSQALQTHGIAYVAPENTRLIDTAEVRDLVALVEALVSPQNDLAVAHALRSPVFSWGDDELVDLLSRARLAKTSWWDALQCWQDAAPHVIETAAHLRRWQSLARTAPPHDLLEAVLTEGHVRQRLVAALPQAQRAQALLHLDALLAQSLDLDGGRDATPYRWVRAMKRLPLTLPGRVHPGAVQLLTIHGAKGLEARVVFVVDTDAEDGRSDHHTVMVDWPESEPRPTRCAFIRSESKPPPSLKDAMAQEHAAQRREEINALYVALTRAREQLVFSRTQPRVVNRQGSWWQRLHDGQAVQAGDLWVPSGPALRGASSASESPAKASLPVLPTLQPLDASQLARSVAVGTVALTDPAQAELAALGQVVHKALEWLTCEPVSQRAAPRIEQAVATACRAVGASSDLIERALPVVSLILSSPELQAWLDPDQLDWAGNEVSLMHGGRTLRLDRLVAKTTASGREWWVLDYKLQHRPQDLPAYQTQMSQYVSAVAQLQPGEVVKAAFMTGEGRLVEVVL